MTTNWWLPDDCWMTTWWLSDDCLTTALTDWQLTEDWMTSYFDSSRVKKLQDENKDYNNYEIKRLPKAKHSKPKKSSHSSSDLAFPRHQASVCKDWFKKNDYTFEFVIVTL